MGAALTPTAPWRSRFVALPRSPLAAGPARVRVREAGPDEAGDGGALPVAFLHAGWGHGAYPFDAQADALAGAGRRCFAPDRSGHGASEPPLAELPRGFHAHAAAETRLVLDALGVRRAVLWGHSDGAVVAALLALEDPARFPVLVLEAAHLWPRKPASRGFFEAAAREPERLVNPRLAEELASDHGARWPEVVRAHGRAWLRLAEEAEPEERDFYGGGLGRLRSRVLVLHGGRDPRTEPGEVEALAMQIPGAEVAVLPQAGHAPHAERGSAGEATARVLDFLHRAEG